MCNKRSSVRAALLRPLKLKFIRIDPCMREFVTSLSFHGYESVVCCCGHGRYPMTVVCKVKSSNRYFDLISGKDIKRKEGGGFYLKDKKGYYYLPEVCKSGNNGNL